MRRFARKEEMPCCFHDDYACDCAMQDREKRSAALAAAYEQFGITDVCAPEYEEFDLMTVAERKEAGDPRSLARMSICLNPQEPTTLELLWEQLTSLLRP